MLLATIKAVTYKVDNTLKKFFLYKNLDEILNKVEITWR